MVERWNVSIAGISDVAISDDGSYVIVGTNTGKAIVFDQNGRKIWEPRLPGTVLVGCQGNGSSFLVASREGMENNKGTMRLFDSAGDVSGRRIPPPETFSNFIHSFRGFIIHP